MHKINPNYNVCREKYSMHLYVMKEFFPGVSSLITFTEISDSKK